MPTPETTPPQRLLYAAFAAMLAVLKSNGVVAGARSHVICQWGDGPCGYDGGCEIRCAMAIRG